MTDFLMSRILLVFCILTLPHKRILSKWFPENFMKLNAGKCHLLTFGTNQDDIKIKIGEAIVEESSEEKLLGVIIDKNLNFKSLKFMQKSQPKTACSC